MNGPDRIDLASRLPAPHPRLRCSVAVPAHDEAEAIGPTLHALAAQRDESGAPLPSGTYEMIVFANGCTDATAAVARSVAAEARVAIHVVEGDLPPARAHVGTARGAAMDAAATRLLALGRRAGAVATTDADSLVHPAWVAETLRALETVDAVGGRITIDPAVLRTLPAALVCALEREERYRFAIARLESRRDPAPLDPWPRHAQQFGASLAVRAEIYRDAGGLPSVPVLEDVALYTALCRRDRSFRHSLRVRVTTSPRPDPRAIGGFGTHLGLLRALGARGRLQHVEHPELTLARIDARATLRRWWREGRDATPASRRLQAVATFALPDDDETDRRLRAAPTFGSVFDDFERAAQHAGAFRLPPATIDVATAALECYAVEISPDGRSANRSIDARPARSSAASGAG